MRFIVCSFSYANYSIIQVIIPLFEYLNTTPKIQTILQIDYTSNKAWSLFVVLQKSFQLYTIQFTMSLPHTNKKSRLSMASTDFLTISFPFPLPKIYISHSHPTQISTHSLPFSQVGHFCIFQPIIGFPEIGP